MILYYVNIDCWNAHLYHVFCLLLLDVEIIKPAFPFLFAKCSKNIYLFITMTLSMVLKCQALCI